MHKVLSVVEKIKRCPTLPFRCPTLPYGHLSGLKWNFRPMGSYPIRFFILSQARIVYHPASFLDFTDLFIINLFIEVFITDQWKSAEITILSPVRQLGNILNFGDFLQIVRSSLNREILFIIFCLIWEIFSSTLTRVIIQRWVITKVVIQRWIIKVKLWPSVFSHERAFIMAFIYALLSRRIHLGLVCAFTLGGNLKRDFYLHDL